MFQKYRWQTTGMVDTKTGEHWFIHFQDKGAYGRIIHLQPMKWINNRPVIGIDKDGDGKGEPVLSYRKPNVGKIYPVRTPDESDEFNSNTLGLQWQWHANSKPYWAFPAAGYLRLFSVQLPDTAKNLWDVPNLLLQKLPAEECMITVKLDFKPRLEGEKAALVLMGADYAYLGITKKAEGLSLGYSTCKQSDKGTPEEEKVIGTIPAATSYLRVTITKGAMCTFSYSSDGTNFINAASGFVAKPGRWIGAKVGLFCTRTAKTNDSGFTDVDWFRVDSRKKD